MEWWSFPENRVHVSWRGLVDSETNSLRSITILVVVGRENKFDGEVKALSRDCFASRCVLLLEFNLKWLIVFHYILREMYTFLCMLLILSWFSDKSPDYLQASQSYSAIHSGTRFKNACAIAIVVVHLYEQQSISCFSARAAVLILLREETNSSL